MRTASHDLLRGASAGLLVSLVVACSAGSSPGSTEAARSGSSTDASLHACSPLEDTTQPTALRNVPGPPVVQYDVSTSNGDRLVVMRPDTDRTNEGFRVFYGTRSRMVERLVLSVTDRGTATTYVTFRVDGVEYTATFQSSMSSLTNATLIANGEEEGLLVNYEDRGVGLSYFCL